MSGDALAQLKRDAEMRKERPTNGPIKADDKVVIRKPHEPSILGIVHTKAGSQYKVLTTDLTLLKVDSQFVYRR